LDLARLDVDDDGVVTHQPHRRAAERGLDRHGGGLQVAGAREASRFGHQALEGAVHELPWLEHQRMRLARADFTAGLACSAPSTTTDSMAASASSGVTSVAMDAR